MADHQPHVALPLCHASVSWQACPRSSAGRRQLEFLSHDPRFFTYSSKAMSGFHKSKFVYREIGKRSFVNHGNKTVIKVGGPYAWGTTILYTHEIPL